MGEQIALVFRGAEESPQTRLAGWDLVAFDARILGASGPCLLARVADVDKPWKLRIALDHPSVRFRMNITMLARAPGLAVRCLGRLRLTAAGEVDLLAIAPSTDTHRWGTGAPSTPPPELTLDASWNGICNLGFDRLERWNVGAADCAVDEISLDASSEYERGEFEGSSWDGLEPVRRRQVAIAMGGRQAISEAGSAAHRRDHHQLTSRFQYTGAQLLDLLALASQGRGPSGAPMGTGKGQVIPPLHDVYLATHLYLQHASRHFQHRLWDEYC